MFAEYSFNSIFSVCSVSICSVHIFHKLQNSEQAPIACNSFRHTKQLLYCHLVKQQKHQFWKATAFCAVGNECTYCTMVEITLEVFQSVSVSWSPSFIIDWKWIGLHSILYSYVHISKSHLKCITDSVEGRKTPWFHGEIRPRKMRRWSLRLSNTSCSSWWAQWLTVSTVFYWAAPWCKNESCFLI